MLFKEITVEEFAEIRAREAAKDAYDEGVAEGEKSGFSKGEKSGAAQEKLSIAKGMLKEGMTNELIAKLTGLSLKEVAAL